MATFDSSTTIKVGRESTGPISISRGVRQGDPLSPLLFNLTIDELLTDLALNYSGGTLPGGTKCVAMAFADDIVLLSDDDVPLPLMLEDTNNFLKHRGMEVNVGKCRALLCGVVGKVSVARSRLNLKIDGAPVPIVGQMNTFRYLGHEFGHSGVQSPGLHNLPEWLSNVQRAPLKPDQKLSILKGHIIPKLLYGLQNPKITGKTLREADRLIKRHLKANLHLNAHTPDAFLYGRIADGGLGITELRKAIPRIFLKRLIGTLEKTTDPVLSSVLQSEPVRHLMARLANLAGETSEAAVWRANISSKTLSQGLQQSSEDSSSRNWIDSKPKGWSGRDYVRAVQLRTANLPTRAIPSAPAEQRSCRGGCGVDESLPHVLQSCPVTHGERIRRHNEIVTKIQGHAVGKGWKVEEEPHVRHRGGQLFKPDLAIHQPGGVTVIADVQVSWDRTDLRTKYHQKRAKYNCPVFREAAASRWPGRRLTFAPVILGARGIWPRINNDESSCLEIPPRLRRSCVQSVLKWGASIHQAFSKAVWSTGPRPAEPLRHHLPV